jgi:hypothetical protein
VYAFSGWDRAGLVANTATQWTSLADILTSGLRTLEMDEGSHRVLLVEPRPDNRAIPRISIVTKTVSQLLWEQDSNNQWQNHRQLFKILHQQPDTKGLCGMLFEPLFHALCVRGTKFTIYPMTRDSEGSVNYKFTNKKCEDSETLLLGCQERVSFNKDNQILKLFANHYYQLTACNSPSCDSFVYNPGSRQVSAFQVTTGRNHGLTSKGVQALHELGQTLGINDLSIRIIMVVLEGGEATFMVEKNLYNRLGLKVYALELTLCKLYGFD